MAGDIHDRNSNDFPQPPFQVFIASRDNEASVRITSVYKTVIRISPFMRTLQTFEATVACDAERESVFFWEFLQFRNDALCDVDDHRGTKAIESTLHDVQLICDGEVDEIGIEKDAERRPKIAVEAKKH